MQCAKHTGKFTCPKHSLLAFEVEINTARIQGYQEVGVTTLDTCSIPAAVVQQCCRLIQKILLKIILPIIFLTLLYVLLFYFYHSKRHGLRTGHVQPLRKCICQLQEKRLAHLVYCTESRIVLKTGQQEKLYPPIDVTVSLQCCP